MYCIVTALETPLKESTCSRVMCGSAERETDHSSPRQLVLMDTTTHSTLHPPPSPPPPPPLPPLSSLPPLPAQPECKLDVLSDVSYEDLVGTDQMLYVSTATQYSPPSPPPPPATVTPATSSSYPHHTPAVAHIEQETQTDDFFRNTYTSVAIQATTDQQIINTKEDSDDFTKKEKVTEGGSSLRNPTLETAERVSALLADHREAITSAMNKSNQKMVLPLLLGELASLRADLDKTENALLWYSILSKLHEVDKQL